MNELEYARPGRKSTVVRDRIFRAVAGAIVFAVVAFAVAFSNSFWGQLNPLLYLLMLPLIPVFGSGGPEIVVLIVVLFYLGFLGAVLGLAMRRLCGFFYLLGDWFVVRLGPSVRLSKLFSCIIASPRK